MDKNKMKIIDAHVHYSRIESFINCAKQTSMVDYSEKGYIEEAANCGVVRSVCMGLTERSPAGFPDHASQSPMLADLADKLPPDMSVCPGINPHALDDRCISEMEDLINDNNRVSGFKIYAGYYHADVTDPVYDPIYKIAEKYDLTIAVHTGDTYSDRGLLKYAHPLCIDALAVAHPELRIVMCHLGVPWVFDACEVAAKNRNVYADLSGMLVGGAETIERMAANPLLTDRYRQALVYLDNYDKVLFGTDWPLVPMNAYIAFCKQLIPPEFYEKVFYSNAAKVYRLK